jgi:phage tail protein X
MIDYTVKRPQTLEMICFLRYGTHEGYLEKVFAVNYGLPKLPVRLPVGTVVKLPDLPKTENGLKLQRLW